MEQEIDHLAALQIIEPEQHISLGVVDKGLMEIEDGIHNSAGIQKVQTEIIHLCNDSDTRFENMQDEMCDLALFQMVSAEQYNCKFGKFVCFY